MISGSKTTEMQGDEGSKSLPEELVEKIMAMVPFPSIFKARLLSKSWLARFEPISSLDDEEKTRHATSFQKQMTKWSNTWETFCPVCITEEHMIAYHQATRRWRQLPSLSFLPEKLFLAALHLRDAFLYKAKEFLYTEGPLLYGTWNIWTSGVPAEELYVANIFTRKSKRLPPRPEVDLTTVHCLKLIIDTSLETYKVVLFCQVGKVGDRRTRQRNSHFAQIYNSKSGTWSSKKFVLASDFSTSPDELRTSCAHLDGVLYMVGSWMPQSLLAFNVEEGTIRERRLPFNGDPLSFKLVVCNANLVMILMDIMWNVRVLRVDLQSLCLREVSGSPFPSTPVKQDSSNIPACLSNIPAVEVHCIIFEMDEHRRNFGWMLGYNQQKDEWNVSKCSKSDYQWSDCSFQPGLNPFMAV